MGDCIVEGGQLPIDENARLGIPRSLFKLITYGTEGEPADETAGRAFRARFNIPGHAFVVCRVATFRPYKGMFLFLDAARATMKKGLPAYFLAVGDGPERAALEKQAADLRLDDRVVFTGAQKDLGPVFAASDVAAHTSLFDEQSMANLQALAAGKPLVATHYGPAIEELVRPGINGALVPPDAEALAEAWSRYAKAPDEQARAGAASRALFEERFDIRRAARETESLYREILARKGVPA